MLLAGNVGLLACLLVGERLALSNLDLLFQGVILPLFEKFLVTLVFWLIFSSIGKTLAKFLLP